MKKVHQIRTAICVGLLALAPAAFAEDYAARSYSDKPESQSLSQAVAFEKYKEVAAEEQARKDAGETRRASQTSSQTSTRSKSAKAPATNGRSQSDHKTGQADTQKRP